MNSNRHPNPWQEEFFKQILDLKNFWKTRKAILIGVPLYDWNSSDRQRSGYLNHWSFNIQESVFVSLPAILLTKILDFLYDDYKTKPPDFSQLDESTRVVSETAYETAYATAQFLSAFAAPAVLTLTAFLLAWCSLKKSDSTPQMRARARSAYLYFDGAYGLYFQLMLSLASSLTIWVFNHDGITEKPIYGLIGTVSFILLVVGSIGQSIETYIKIPRKLFKINSYSSRRRWGKYLSALLLGTSLISIGVFVIIFILSFITAIILTFMKMLFFSLS